LSIALIQHLTNLLIFNERIGYQRTHSHDASACSPSIFLDKNKKLR